ncbi:MULTISPECIES: crossover junction endodeoxyribonuclease RuvC [Fusobacterium]|uniref:crossover junction endodeoxyribonuclease RuvC n=1 Tax=Fusobacterium TaxID=848 RepID=UPI0014776718|nr:MULTISPECIES: crossover junction endodeoxyribonuclease RuvC [Fusobacterium]NME36076.1 crossover junction endodeoxyribonuclease RuvC [Fusobacterium sp. FSA-380-WT-3A]
MKILGIDPGTAIVGFSIIELENSSLKLLDYGCIYTDKNLSMNDRLLIIFNELEKIINKYSPDHMAIEELFYFKNNKTVISVGEARGVILLAGKKNNLSIYEYTPLQVKIGITGYGKADKKQVQLMVKTILKLKEIPKPDDAADAIAIAITHINSLKTLQYSNISSSVLSTKNLSKTKMSVKEFRELLLNSK